MRDARMPILTALPLLVVFAVAACTAAPDRHEQGAAGSATTSKPDAPAARTVASVGTREIPKCTVYVDASASGDGTASAPFATIEGNVFRDNHCFRGGAGAIADPAKGSDVTFANNVVDGNSGDEAESAHGGGIYLFATKLTITGNVFTNNTVTGWGGGLFVGSDPSGDQHTTASLSWNVFRGNAAGNAGGGLFCDDGATCNSDHDLFDANCGSNVFLDSAYEGGPTIASFDHMTNVNALDVGCGAPGAGIQTDHGRDVPDAYEVKNSIFFNNAVGRDVNAGCSDTCQSATVTISTSMVQREHPEGIPVTFGTGIVEPVDPLFVDAAKGDYHLQSTNGHFTAGGDVKDSSSSPALRRGADGEELGIYGGSGEASK
ncbi:MAG: hypothetical protein QOD90_1769 [Mycobacterium sp.]|nr:hypothetical protein [Mycobacterium sp.]